MAYFVFNPQTNSLDDSDHPTPIRKNLGEKLLAKNDNIYPWGYDKNPPWPYIPKDPFDPSIHERFLEDFDIRNETMHADGGLVRPGFYKAQGPRTVGKYKGKYVVEFPNKKKWKHLKQGGIFAFDTLDEANAAIAERAKLSRNPKSGTTISKIIEYLENVPEGQTVSMEDITKYLDSIGHKSGPGGSIRFLRNPEMDMSGKGGVNKATREKLFKLQEKVDNLYPDYMRPLHEGGKIKDKKTIAKISELINDPAKYKTKESVMKALGYKTDPRPGKTYGMGSFNKLLKLWEEATGETLDLVKRFPETFRYKGSQIAADIINEVKTGLAKGETLKVRQLAKKHLKDYFIRDEGGARATIRGILAGEIDIDWDARQNIAGENTGAKNVRARRWEKIKAAAKLAGKDAVKQVNSLKLDVENLNDTYRKLAKTDPEKILNNKKLIDALSVTFDVETGEVGRKTLSRDEILRMVDDGIFELEHIRPVHTVKFEPGKTVAKKVVGGHAVGWPTNLQITTRNMNGQFLNNVENYMFQNKLDVLPESASEVLKNQELRIYANGNYHGAGPGVGWNTKDQTSDIFKRNLNALDLEPNPKLFGDEFLKKAGNVIKPIAKYAGKVGAKVLGTVFPVLAPAAVGLGLYDMNRARAEGLTRPQELGTAYYLGPEAAQGMRNITDYDYKDRAGKEWENIKESWSAGPTGVTEDISEQVEFAQGGIVPRIEYRDGSMLGDARGWEKMLDLSDPDVVAKLEAKKVMDEQKDAEYREQAHDKRLLHRTDDYYTSQEESFIPHYVKDVAKTTFGTQEGRQYFGSKLLEGAVEGTEWLVMQIPHLMKQVNPVGLMKLQKEMEEGNFSWMDLLYEPKLGEKWGMNKYQQQKLEELREQAIAEGKPGIPQGVETLGTTGELGAMFADPFMMYAGYRKAAPWIKGSHARLKKAKAEEQVDMGRRDTMKVLGGGGLMIALAKIFPGIFKGGKAKVASKVAKTNYVKQFGNVRGMPDWFPSFMLKATQKGKLKSLPDKDYIYGTVYEVMLPVKKRLGKGKIKTEQVPVSVEVNPNTGTMTVRWTGTDNFGDDIERSINYKPGETGTQNYAADEYGRGTSKEEVVIQDPEFEYVEPDYTSMGPEDTSPDSAMSLDIYDEADEIVEAMEEFVKGADDKFKKKAADEFRLYNQTDEHLGDATGHQTSDGDWVSGDDNMPFPDYDKKTKDVYHRSEFDKSLDTKRKKKAMGGVASGPPPLSGPVPQGLPSLQPGDIYNEWIR